MNITVSYLSKINELDSVLKKIDQTSADSIHLDLIDGLYVGTKNFYIETLPNLFRNVSKPLDVHLMVENPEDYVNVLYKMPTNIIFFHPKTSKDVEKLIFDIKNHGKKAGLVINPNEDFKDFKMYLSLIDAILILSVYPGKGGQKFIRDSLVNYELLKEEKKNHHYLIYVDGGINDETITYVKDADGTIVGSYVCDATDYEKQIQSLRNAIV